MNDVLFYFISLSSEPSVFCGGDLAGTAEVGPLN